MPSLHKSAFRLMKKEIETIIHVSARPKGFGRIQGYAPKIRAQRKKTAYRKAEIKAGIIEWTVGVLVVVSLVSRRGIYFLGKKQEKW